MSQAQSPEWEEGLAVGSLTLLLTPHPHCHPSGVDNSTYCDYQLLFLLHIHGFPISAKRALFILMVSVCPGEAQLAWWDWKQGTPPAPTPLRQPSPECSALLAGVGQHLHQLVHPLHYHLHHKALCLKGLQLSPMEDKHPYGF